MLPKSQAVRSGHPAGSLKEPRRLAETGLVGFRVQVQLRLAIAARLWSSTAISSGLKGFCNLEKALRQGLWMQSVLCTADPSVRIQDASFQSRSQPLHTGVRMHVTSGGEACKLVPVKAVQLYGVWSVHLAEAAHYIPKILWSHSPPQFLLNPDCNLHHHVFRRIVGIDHDDIFMIAQKLVVCAIKPL